MGDAQRLDIAPIFAPLDGRGLLDSFAAWYVKAAAYIARSPTTDWPFNPLVDGSIPSRPTIKINNLEYSSA